MLVQHRTRAGVHDAYRRGALEDAGAFVLRDRRDSGDAGVDGVVWTPIQVWIAV